MKDMQELTQDVEQWARDKNIHKAEPTKQFAKVIEEIGEVASALSRDYKNDLTRYNELKDGIGDSLVTLIILAQQCDTSALECLNLAYNVISERKGKTVDGVFIKESDLSC